MGVDQAQSGTVEPVAVFYAQNEILDSGGEAWEGGEVHRGGTGGEDGGGGWGSENERDVLFHDLVPVGSRSGPLLLGATWTA